MLASLILKICSFGVRWSCIIQTGRVAYLEKGIMDNVGVLPIDAIADLLT